MVTNGTRALTGTGGGGCTGPTAGRPCPRKGEQVMRARRLLASTGALAVALLTSAGLTTASAPTSASAAVAECHSSTSAARVVKGATAKEPALYAKSDAK